MAEYRRLAVYYVPDDPALADFGAHWLGWDIRREAYCDQDAELVEITATPRKYGFHGTLKAPFRLAEAQTLDALLAATKSLAADMVPVQVARFQVKPLGGFLALVPVADVADLARLAFRCVSELDAFRAPPSDAELARRRAAGLSARQEEMLQAWGYPYVGDEFRFHMTLSGPLSGPDLARAQPLAEAALPPLPEPFEIASIALAGERDDGQFAMIQRFALGG